MLNCIYHLTPSRVYIGVLSSRIYNIVAQCGDVQIGSVLDGLQRFKNRVIRINSNTNMMPLCHFCCHN